MDVFEGPPVVANHFTLNYEADLISHVVVGENVKSGNVHKQGD